MSFPSNDLTVEELRLLLFQKSQQCDQMIRKNKEFEDVKKLFYEIRDLEKKLGQDHNWLQDSPDTKNKKVWVNPGFQASLISVRP